MALQQKPYPSKFIINEESSNSSKYFSKKFSYEDLLIAGGDHIKDYTDLTEVAKDYYSAYSTTLSETMNPFYEYLNGNNSVKDVEENFVRWRIYSTPDRRAISMGDPNEANSDGCYGAGAYPFKIRLDVDWFKEYDVLSPIRNKRCQVVVQGDPRFVGGAYEYEVILLDNPESASVFPVEYLTEGFYFIKMGSLGSDLGSNEWGSIQFGFDNSYIEFETKLTTMQWKFEVEHEAHEKWGNLEIARCGEDGNVIPGTGKITNFLELEAMAQIEKEKELFMAYGTGTDFMVSKSTGKRITTGAGLFEFMEEGNVIPYNPQTNGMDKIVSEIDSLWFDRVAPGNRKLMLYTGQGGLKLFHDWIEEKYGNTAVVTPYNFVLGDAPAFDGSRNGYALNKYQFTKYYVPVFGEITVAHWPILDNTRINGVTYPGTHYPVSSFEFFAFDYGLGESNVQMLRNSKREATFVIPGLSSPFGLVGKNNPAYSHPTNPDHWGYYWSHRCSFGMVMMDPGRSVKFVPAIAG